MKTINFIQPIPAHQQQTFRTWVILSCILLISCAIGIGIIWIQQRNTLHQLQQEQMLYKKKQEQWQTSLTEKQELLKQQTILQERQELIKRFSAHKQSLLTIMHKIPEALASHGTLSTCIINPPTIEITITYPAANGTVYQKFIDHMPQIRNLKLASLIHQQDLYTASLKGTIDALPW